MSKQQLFPWIVATGEPTPSVSRVDSRWHPLRVLCPSTGLTRYRRRRGPLSKSTIEGELPDGDLYACVFNVFPRTLHKGLRQKWRQWEAVSGFIDLEELSMEFVASHSSEQDRSNLVNQLRQPTKPKEQSVQSFYSRLLGLNDAVSFLPSDDEPLTDIQLKKACYDGMQASWKERFVSSEDPS
jgi:hypothetical protein